MKRSWKKSLYTLKNKSNGKKYKKKYITNHIMKSRFVVLNMEKGMSYLRIYDIPWNLFSIVVFQTFIDTSVDTIVVISIITSIFHI